MGGGGGGVVTGEEVEVEIFAKSKTNRESAKAANWKCVPFSPAQCWTDCDADFTVPDDYPG